MARQKYSKKEREDHVILSPITKPNGRKGVKVTKPGDVFRCEDKEDLQEALKHFSKPLLKHLVPDSQMARRKYVEKIRPALRYYCKKFGVKVPTWLVDDKYYTERMSSQEKLKAFGTDNLKIREFGRMRAAPQGGRGDAPE